jgi:hypothetical protein
MDLPGSKLPRVQLPCHSPCVLAVHHPCSLLTFLFMMFAGCWRNWMDAFFLHTHNFPISRTTTGTTSWLPYRSSAVAVFCVFTVHLPKTIRTWKVGSKLLLFWGISRWRSRSVAHVAAELSPRPAISNEPGQISITGKFIHVYVWVVDCFPGLSTIFFLLFDGAGVMMCCRGSCVLFCEDVMMSVAVSSVLSWIQTIGIQARVGIGSLPGRIHSTSFSRWSSWTMDGKMKSINDELGRDLPITQ